MYMYMYQKIGDNLKVVWTVSLCSLSHKIIFMLHKQLPTVGRCTYMYMYNVHMFCQCSIKRGFSRAFFTCDLHCTLVLLTNFRMSGMLSTSSQAPTGPQGMGDLLQM